MKKQIEIFWAAVMFYTRIPCPANIHYSEEYLNKSTRFLPLIGWIVGGISFLAFWISYTLWGVAMAVVISLIAGILLTGAFHEDGFADVFDGFGGGWTQEKILEIMKDSRIGTFGVLALVLLFFTKFWTIHEITIQITDPLELLLIFVTYHSLARLGAATIIFLSRYARNDEKSKVKPIAKSYGRAEVIGAYFFGILPLGGLACLKLTYLLVLLLLGIVIFRAKQYFEKWLGGYTGDCLGAVEQLSEVCILLTFQALCRFS